MSSQSVAMLIIPPRLDTPQYTENLKIPKSIDGRDGEIDELVNAPVLPKFINLEIRKEGVARWLEVEVDPVSLWPYVVKFWDLFLYIQAGCVVLVCSLIDLKQVGYISSFVFTTFLYGNFSLLQYLCNFLL